MLMFLVCYEIMRQGVIVYPLIMSAIRHTSLSILHFECANLQLFLETTTIFHKNIIEAPHFSFIYRIKTAKVHRHRPFHPIVQVGSEFLLNF